MTQPVIIYSTTWCAYCKALKEYLTQKGIGYEEKDIEKDESAFNELKTKMGDDYRGAVPVSDIGGTMILGFDRPKIDAAIA